MESLIGPFFVRSMYGTHCMLGFSIWTGNELVVMQTNYQYDMTCIAHFTKFRKPNSTVFTTKFLDSYSQIISVSVILSNEMNEIMCAK